METYRELWVTDADELIFGRSPRPLRLKNGLSIGAGTVYPEINFTLPDISIAAETLPEIRRQYSQMIAGVCKRAVELQAPGLVVEFELLPELTLTPEWGAEITALLRSHGAEVVEALTFPDHHAFNAADVARLEALADTNGAKLATTEKDAVRLTSLANGAALLKRLLRVPIRLELRDDGLAQLAALIENRMIARRAQP